VKRLFDLAFGSVLLVLTSPFWIVGAIVAKVGGKGPVIYRSRRVGKDGRTFTILKFSTMVPGPGPALTQPNDPRITRGGRWLRKWKLDELPQLLNVLKGDMSLVGPRPEDPRYVALYTPEQRRVLSVRPGIVGPTALYFRNEEALLATLENLDDGYVNEVMPRKLAMDLQYLDDRSLRGDLLILARTLKALFS
jgi:lipopolysaccharide/colanic/teichoic acid biosynthesis glycosyltransferase